LCIASHSNRNDSRQPEPPRMTKKAATDKEGRHPTPPRSGLVHAME